MAFLDMSKMAFLVNLVIFDHFWVIFCVFSGLLAVKPIFGPFLDPFLITFSDPYFDPILTPF
jgi:hypothetical protein